MPFHSGQSIVAVEFTAPEDNVRFFDVRPDRWISLVFILSFFYESLLGRYGVSSPSGHSRQAFVVPPPSALSASVHRRFSIRCGKFRRTNPPSEL